MNDQFNNQNNYNNYNNNPMNGVNNQPMNNQPMYGQQPVYNQQPVNNMYQGQPQPVPQVQSQPVPPVQPQQPVPPVQPQQPVQPQVNGFQQVNNQPMNNGFQSFNNGYPQNNGVMPNNNQYNNNNNFVGSPYTAPKKTSPVTTIIIIAVIAAIILIGVLVIPTFLGKSPKGEWTCTGGTFDNLKFESDTFEFSKSSGSYTATMTGNYKKIRGGVKPEDKKDGYSYTAFSVSDVKVSSMGYSTTIDSEDKGFIIGFSKDEKSIHYLAGEEAGSESFTCTKKD